MYVKTVQQLDKEGQPTETQRFQLLPSLQKNSVRLRSDQGIVGEFQDEFNIAIEVVATDPEIRDFFTFETRGDTIVARRKADAQYRVDLVEQRFVFLNETQQLRYIFTAINRRSVFYGSRFRVEVFFTPKGHYLRHSLRFSSELFLLGSQGNIAIKGRLAG